MSLQNLCSKLDNYAFVKGEVCVFDWIELIKQEIIDELVFDKNLDEQINDPRALNGHLAENIDQIYQYLINYNNEREEKQFRNQLQTCLICTDMISGQGGTSGLLDFLVLLGTSRYFFGTSRYFFGTSRYFLGTSRYFLVLFGTFWYFSVLSGTSRYFLVLFGTFWYFTVLFGTFRYFVLCRTDI
jgi:hypothetical protein